MAAQMADGGTKLKVSIVLNTSGEAAGGGRCVEVSGDGLSVAVRRPGSAAAPSKTYGPFPGGVWEGTGAAEGLADRPPAALADEMRACLAAGCDFGVFSFGSLGQGKTAALWGAPPGPPPHVSPGVAPEAALAPALVAALFPALDALCAGGGGWEVGVGVSFLRVSAVGGEMLNDCLNADFKASGLGLRLREQLSPCLPVGGFYLDGLTVRPVTDTAGLTAAALDGLDAAEALDRNDATAQRGARSHKLLTVTVLRRQTASGDLYASKVHVLDCAGVERSSQAAAAQAVKAASKPFGGKTPQQRAAAMRGGAPGGGGSSKSKEDATHKAIIRVCDSLAAAAGGGGGGRAPHIPYRDAKLTRLLSTALGGGGVGAIVGCVGVLDQSFAETDAMLAFLHKCATAVACVPRPRVVNAARERAAAEPDIVALAREHLGIADPAAALALQPHEVECTMESAPGLAELRDLVAAQTALLHDPLAALLRSESK